MFQNISKSWKSKSSSYLLSFLVLQMKELCVISYVIYVFSEVSVHWFCWPRTKSLYYLNWFSIQATLLLIKPSTSLMSQPEMEIVVCVCVCGLSTSYSISNAETTDQHKHTCLTWHRKCGWRWWNEEKIFISPRLSRSLAFILIGNHTIRTTHKIKCVKDAMFMIALLAHSLSFSLSLTLANINATATLDCISIA